MHLGQFNKIDFDLKSYKVLSNFVLQPTAFVVSFLQSQISNDVLVLYYDSFAMFRWKETKEIEIDGQD